MDYETKSISRIAIRHIAGYVRRIFGCKSDDEPFPVLQALELLPDLFPGSNYDIVENELFPANVFARCLPKSEGGFTIQIKQAVYEGAYEQKVKAFLSFICHEICHIVLFNIGFTPISNRTVNDKDTIPAYRSVEWQAKALCGEVMIPYEATKGMKAKDISEKYVVTEAAAKYRVKQDRAIKVKK